MKAVVLFGQPDRLRVVYRRTALARQNLQRAGLARQVELCVQDAATALRDSPSAHWHLIFLDAERPYYEAYVPDLVRCLSHGGMHIVDNVPPTKTNWRLLPAGYAKSLS